MSDDILLIVTIAASAILIFMLVIIRIGLKGSRERDLLSPPPLEDLAAGEAGMRVAVLPERENMDLEEPERVADPHAPIAEASTRPRQPVLGDNEIESTYSAEQLMEREVKAMLLQQRPDRAIAHVMQVKRVDRDEAEKIIAGFAGESA